MAGGDSKQGMFRHMLVFEYPHMYNIRAYSCMFYVYLPTQSHVGSSAVAPPPQGPSKLVTPGGILAEAGKVQTGVQPVQPGLPPVKGAYTVPGAPTAPADTTAEDQAAAQATEDARIQKMFAEQIAANELANAQRIYNTTRRDTAGPQTTFTSAAAARAGTQKIKEDWANLIDSGGM
jgi:hypothetical protein